MNIIGADFYGDYDCYNSSPIAASNITSCTLQNGIFDVFYASTDLNEYGKLTLGAWNDTTLVYATFNGSLVGGNIDDLTSKIQYIRLKRRNKETGEWITLADKKVEVSSDLSFVYVDKFAKGRNTVYDYALVPIVYGSEQNMDIATVVSDFDGAVIADKDNVCHVLYDVNVNTTQRNKNSNTVTTLASKYPYVTYGGNANYETGSFSGTVIESNIDDTNVEKFNYDHSPIYRENIATWLTNGEAKILKTFDGRIWLMNVDGNVTTDCSEHYNKVGMSFDFVETGDAENSSDLFNAGLIDINIDERS